MKKIKPKTLFCVLTAFWYDQIETGLKRVEYREVKSYWSKRLYGCSPGDKIIFSRGYTKRRMMATVTKIEIVYGLNTDLHTNKNVYAIHFENVQKYKG